MPEPLSLTPLDAGKNNQNLTPETKNKTATPVTKGVKHTTVQQNSAQSEITKQNNTTPKSISDHAKKKTSLKDKTSNFLSQLGNKKEEQSKASPPVLPQVLTPQSLSIPSAPTSAKPKTASATPAQTQLKTHATLTAPSPVSQSNTKAVKADSEQLPPPPNLPKAAEIATQPTIPQNTSQTSLKKESEKTGNLFTRLFKGSKVNEEKGSIIDAIVSKEEEKKAEAKKAKLEQEEAKKTPKKASDVLGWYRASRFLFHFTLLFIAVASVFLYMNIIDVNNSIYSWFDGPTNYASRLNEAQLQLDELKRQEAQVKGDVTRFQQGYNDPNEKIVEQIIDQRSSLREVEQNLYGAAEELYPNNSFFNYLEYTNFNINFDTNQVSFSAVLKDPSGNNFSALADFENILKFYPDDPKEDTGIQPYFTNIQEINNYSERLNQNTGETESIFSMSATLNTGPTDAL